MEEGGHPTALDVGLGRVARYVPGMAAPPPLDRALQALPSPLASATDWAPLDAPGTHPGVRWRCEVGQRALVLLLEPERAHVELWSHGVCHAAGWLSTLEVAAQVTHGWLCAQAAASAMGRSWPALTLRPHVGAFEQSTQAFVSWKWGRIAQSPSMGALFPVLARAMRHPLLSRLFPYRSGASLHFSRTTGHPYASEDLPWVGISKDGGFEVHGAVGAMHARDAEEALSLLDRLLPPDAGPAITGTREDPGHGEGASGG